MTWFTKLIPVHYLLMTILALFLALSMSGWWNLEQLKTVTELKAALTAAQTHTETCQKNQEVSYETSYDFQTRIVGDLDTRFDTLIGLYTPECRCAKLPDDTGRPHSCEEQGYVRGVPVNPRRVLEQGRQCEKYRQQLIRIEQWTKEVSDHDQK